MFYFRAGVIIALASACMAYEVFHASHPRGHYQMSYWQAHELCSKNGAHLATKHELEEMRRANYSMCNCGWVLDKSAHFPMTHSVRGCGGKPGLHVCDWGSRWDAYCFRGDPLSNCSKALGIQSGGIHDSQMYASSEFRSWYPIFSNSRWMAKLARLHNKDLVNAWVPAYDGRNQWLEVDLEKPTAVTGIVTQGASRLGKKMWVESFKIKHSKDGYNYKTIKVDGQDKIFQGNRNNDGLKRNMFPEPVLTRYIRYVPHRHHRHVALRLELLGCEMQTYIDGMSRSENIEVSVVNGGQTDVFAEMPPEDA